MAEESTCTHPRFRVDSVWVDCDLVTEVAKTLTEELKDNAVRWKLQMLERVIELMASELSKPE